MLLASLITVFLTVAVRMCSPELYVVYVSLAYIALLYFIGVYLLAMDLMLVFGLGAFAFVSSFVSNMEPITIDDGRCYLQMYSTSFWKFAYFVLGDNPFGVLLGPIDGRKYSIIRKGCMAHLELGAGDGGWVFAFVGSSFDSAQGYMEKVADAYVSIPSTNFDRVQRNIAGMITESQQYLPHVVDGQRSLFAKRVVPNMTYDGPIRNSGVRSINTASAMASARILLGSDAMQGEYLDNKGMALEVFENKSVLTSLNPTSKQYRKLVEVLRMPLQYSPSITEHDAAGTCRRAWMMKMQEATGYGRVGMLSPSLQEWHTNPTGVGHYYNMQVGVDASRINKPCKACRTRRCLVLHKAQVDGRVSYGSLDNAAYLMKMYQVDYLWMLNIEPNINSKNVLNLMVRAGIENGFSAFHVNWEILHSDKAYCHYTEQETTHIMGKVISKFSGSGSYVQSMADVRDLFAPTFSSGKALRRTIVGRAGTSMLVELNVDHSGFGTSFIPDQWQYYLIPVPHPVRGVAHLKVEREGFDRVLQTFRTTVNKNVEAARIQLRQSNVTYSVSGTQLTPRLKVSASDYELLALWMVSYSIIMDNISEVGMKSMNNREKECLKEGSVKKITGSIYNTVVDKVLANSSEHNPQFGSQSSVRKWLRMCEADGRFLTLEEISHRAYEETFGNSFSIDVGLNGISSLYGKLFSKIPGVYSTIVWARDLTHSLWSAGFNTVDVLMKVMIMTGSVSSEGAGFVLDMTEHCCRVLGIRSEPVTRLRNYLDTRNIPVGQLWVDISSAQDLDFQAASIKIVESLVNNFSPDADMLTHMMMAKTEGVPVTDVELRERKAKAVTLETSMADIPYTRFLSELKIFLGKINSRGQRISQMHSILSIASERRNTLPDSVQENIDKLMSDAKAVVAEIKHDESVKVTTSCFNVSMRAPSMKQLGVPPVHVVSEKFVVTGQTSTNEAFKQGLMVDLDAGTGKDKHRYLKRLPFVDGKCDFTEIHDLMEGSFPGYSVEVHSLDELPELPVGAICQYSPDNVGGKFLENIAKKAAVQGMKEMRSRDNFATPNQLRDWIESRSQMAKDKKPIYNAIKNSASRLKNVNVPFLMHIDGLAMGGKSAGIRNWISDQDCVVVPSNELKKEWLSNLGELDPVHRASVYTQHMAMNQDCSRFIIIDEIYTFETPHIEILRRFPNAKGLITIGDGHQIRDVFSEGTSTFNPVVNKPFFTAVAPVSFAPYDVLVQYLRNNDTPVYNKVYYSGTMVQVGMHYCIESDEIILPSKEDRVINGTQAAKGMMIARGVPSAITSHESQGSRCEFAFVHTTEAFGACPDMAFLAKETRHYGVTITRARKGVCFVVKDKKSGQDLPYVDPTSVNGLPIPNDVLYAGTSFDLIDPVTNDDIKFERFENENVMPTANDMTHCDQRYTVGSFIDEVKSEAVALEAFKSDIDVNGVSVINTHVNNIAPVLTETMLFNPAKVPGAGIINMLERHTKPTTITLKHYKTARLIVNRLFDRVIDPHMFMKLASCEKGAIGQQSRDQIMKMADSRQVSRSDTVSFAFPKNEPAKKVMTLGKGLKALSVTAMNQTQLQMFGDCANILTHAWARSLRPGILSPVGFTKPEIARKLGSMVETWEIDLEKQDSTHSATHVAVFVLFIEMVAKRQGMKELAEEIRSCRTIGDMQGVLRIVMGTGLGSGDIWTLIANKIMAFSVLVSLYDVPSTISMLQVGDDITCDRKLRKAKKQLTGSEGVTLKIIDNNGSGRPSFTSNVAINPDISIAARVRGIIKMAFTARNRTQHISFKVETNNIKHTIANIGISEYAEVFQKLFGADPSFVEFIVTRALDLSNMAFDDLPDELKLHEQDEKKCVIHSRNQGCFGYALAYCVGGNVQALNALATFTGPVSKSVAIDNCVANQVDYEVMDKVWYDRSSPQIVVDDYLKRNKSTSKMYIFDNHAVSITSVSSETVSFGGTHRYKVNLLTEEVDELDFY
ncbi:RdRp [Botrytis cinerea alpha-like virus 1]|uniref:RdRp n=1 Tax=Botrytis cinerea alpha-like virus 1 TaxID=2735873 RepID=A0A858YA25_9VIRU|nr:RdRp [Botrytis cinerea alpha-like virus 1]